MSNNYFIIHGSYGNPYKNWIPWLRGELAKRKLDVIVPNFPILKYQNYDNWSKVLKAYLDIGCINENTIFITHSLGCIFLIKFILENKVNIKRIVAVAGFNNLYFDDDEELYRSFYIDNERLKNINKYCKDVICIYSDNDSFVSLDAISTFNLSFNCQRILINGAGHFNKESGFDEFKEILKYLK